MEDNTTPTTEALDAAELIAARNLAHKQFQWARDYTMQLIESVPQELWYVCPGDCHTHLAWQVGHLAVSEYGLLLFRLRGRQPEDLQLMPGWLRKQFGRGSVPAPKSEKSPTAEQLMDHLRAIHEQAMQAVPMVDADSLNEPMDMPYAVYPTRLGAILFAPIHEAIHAGQIGMVRRLHGLEPIR